MTPASLPDLARVVAAFASIPHCRLLGMRLEEVRRGSGMMSLDWSERLVGNAVTRVIHSGAVTALLDTLCGLVVMASVPEGTPLATLDLRIDYLRPATPERRIRATAECYKVTHSVAFVHGLAFNDDPADAIAHCTGTFMLGGVGFSAAAAGGEPGAGRSEGGQPC